MPVLSVDCYSEALGFQTTFQAIMPEKRSAHTRVLYLLHGLLGDDKQWIQSSSIIRHVENRNLAVFMPNVHRGYYTDMKSGPKYWTFLTKDLPEMIRNIFALHPERNDTFIGGLSMGGYGALKWGLSEPQKFAKVFALSPAVDIAKMRREDAEREREFAWIFGSEKDFEASVNDLFHLLQVQKTSALKGTSFLQICGTEDPFYRDNLKFKKLIVNYSVPYQFIDRVGGHNWEFWNSEITMVLDWLDQ